MADAYVVTSTADYNPNGSPTEGTLRWALQFLSGARTVTVDPAVVSSGITLTQAYGPIIIRNTGLTFSGDGMSLDNWGITVACSYINIDGLEISVDQGDNGRGLLVTDGSSAQDIQDVHFSNILLVGCSDDTISCSQQNQGSTFRNVTFNGVVVSAAEGQEDCKPLLISGPNFGAIDGEFEFTNCSFGLPGSECGLRIPLISGGLHHFTDCAFYQGRSTGDLQNCHVNFDGCSFFTRAEPPGQPYWYSGRLMGLRYTSGNHTKVYFTGCELDEVAADADDICKVFSIAADVSIPAGCISGTPLSTIPQNPVPAITSLSPDTIATGSGDTAVTITGTGFRQDTSITVEGISVEPTLSDTIQGTEIAITVPASSLVNARVASVIAETPAIGGGTSNDEGLSIEDSPGTFGPTVSGKDGSLREVVPTRNYGVATVSYLLSPASTQENASIWSWDVSAIPLGVTVVSATLTLTIVGWNNSNAVTDAGKVYPLTRDFVKGTGNNSVTADGADWNTYNGSAAWSPGYDAGKGGDFDASFGSAYSLSYAAPPTVHNLNVATAVQKALDSYRVSGLIGLLAKSDGTNGVNQLANAASRNHATAGSRPTLTIEYTEPATGAGPASTLMLMGVGL